MRRLLLLFCLLLTVRSAWAQDGRPEYVLTLRSQEAIGRISKEYRVTKSKQINGTAIFLVQPANGDAPLIKKLNQDKDVLSLEINAKLKLDDSGETLFLLDDTAETLFLLDGRTQVTLNGIPVPKAYAEQRALTLVEGDKARRLSTGAATRVATIDTGADFDHPALRIWLHPGIDLVNGRSPSEYDGLSLDDAAETLFLLDGKKVAGLPPAFGHGTMVAGMIHLMAPDALIVPIKAFDAYGGSTLWTITEAVYRAIALNVDAINMSFSTGVNSTTLRAAIKKAHSLGITIVSSMGNNKANIKDIYPAAYSEVIAVAATDFQDRLATFSNFGKAVSLSAPGSFVVTTFPGGNYALAWGTSFSAPIVSGAASLAASLKNRGTSQGPAIVNTSDPIDSKNPGFEKLLGKGRLNARRALEHR